MYAVFRLDRAIIYSVLPTPEVHAYTTLSYERACRFDGSLVLLDCELNDSNLSWLLELDMFEALAYVWRFC